MILIEADKQRAKLAALAEWRPWFAWHPVQVEGGDVVWWEEVERRTEVHPNYAGVGTVSFTYYRRREQHAT